MENKRCDLIECCCCRCCYVMTIGKLKQHLPLLRQMLRWKAKSRKAVLRNADRDLVCVICELIQNVMQGNVKLPPKQLAKLRRHRHVLRKIVDKRTGITSKRTLLAQKGGGLLSVLVPTVAALIGSLVSGK